MAYFKYQKKPTIVEVTSIPAPADYGVLGSLTTDDKVIQLASGALYTMDAATFATKYDVATETATLTGSDWD